MKAVENIKGLVKEGNTCLFLIFVIFNFFVFLCSMGIIGCAIYLFVITSEANVFNISFIVVGGVLFLFSLLAFWMRRSVHLLGLYLLILAVVFFFQLIITIIMAIKKEKLLELAYKYMSDSSESIEELKRLYLQLDTGIDAVTIALFAFTGILVRYKKS